MPSQATARTSRNTVLIIVSVILVTALIAAVVYLSRPVSRPAASGPASTEAKAYLPYLALSDVTMQATENFMKQQVVEVKGKISNKGTRELDGIEVYCVFYGVDGREVYRERQFIVSSKGAPLKPGQTRTFRLPFDNLPDTWNQALPRLVIAQIMFGQ
ncbi:MAG: DUF2393 family protein [Acidobacteriaceae bacterium]|nr:DUF2393 family protein [Acidobacteriaceae bacterium]